MATRNVLACVSSILWIFLQTIQAKNILIFPVHGNGSHYFFMTKIAMELVNRGHNITMLVNRNYEERVKALDQPFQFEFYNSTITRAEYDYILKNKTQPCLTVDFSTLLPYAMKHFGSDCAQSRNSRCVKIFKILNDVELLSKLKKSTFDLAVVDANLRCPILQHLWQHSGIPYVVICPMLNTPCLEYLQNRFPDNLSYMPGPARSMDHGIMFAISNGARSLLTWLMIGIQSGIANPFQSSISKDVSLLHPNAELCLINTHFALEFPRPPLMPNTVPVGGLTTGPAQSLDQEWEEFLQSAGEYGVVLSSMGTYVRGTEDEIVALLAGAFAQLPQKVIWELRGNTSVTLPLNVKLVDRMPQNDLLGHSQVKVFVYHSGLHGIWEAVYHGVPMVVLPLFADQPYNAQRMVSRGIGVKLNINNLTSNVLADAIRTVINDPSYKRNAKHMSAIFRDTPRTPVQVAGDWLECVIRHRDEKHLPSGTLTFFKYLPLDVFFVLVVTFITCYHLILLM